MNTKAIKNYEELYTVSENGTVTSIKTGRVLKQELINEYDGELIDSVLNELEIEIKSKNRIEENYPIQSKQIIQPREHNYSSTILPIELNPGDENEFLKKLLLKKSAFITIYYANGQTEKKIWNANRMQESSTVIGNLRSRQEFRNGEWQKRGIIKVFVSME